MPTDPGSLAVIGGGVIGLAVARRAAQAGWSVRVLGASVFDDSIVTNTLGVFGTSLLPGKKKDGGLYSASNMVSWINDLSRSSVALSVASCNLNAAALNRIFTDLGTVTSGVITITNTPGGATCNRALATAKGWTVTG